jgi:quercetin dioxygenase-like cupin family protein
VKVWREPGRDASEPNGHYGGVEAADIVDKAVTGNFAVSTMLCPPKSGGVMHNHEDDAQLFLVSRGRLTFATGDEQFSLGPMEAVLFEPGDPHSTVNDTEDDCLVVVVTVSTPKDT